MTPTLPEWAPRVPQALIRELYENDARGMPDAALIDEVGWRLRARCLSFIQAVDAVRGHAACAQCGSLIEHHSRPDELLTCPECGWSLPWMDYFATLQKRQLSGAEPVLIIFREFCEKFPRATSFEEKMLRIDQLIHAFHINLVNQRPTETRAAAVNLIEGRYHEVVHFLDRLSYTPESTSGVQSKRNEWREIINRTAEEWQDERLRLDPE